MFFCILYLLSALSISAVAAYFSVIGLATIFPGSITSVIIMGGVLEIGKIVTAIWLHRNWKSSPFLVKSYLSFATLVLMGITSMGIFGFLSRAHIEHETNTQRSVAMAETIDSKIDREKDYIDRQKQQIESLKESTTSTASTARLDIDQETQKIKDITEQLNKDMSFEQNRIVQQNGQLEELDKALKDLEKSSGGLFSNKNKKIEQLKTQQAPTRESIIEKKSTYNSNIDNFRSTAQDKIKIIEEKITSFRNLSSQKDTSTLPQIEEFSKNIAEAHGRIDLLEVEKIGFQDSARELEAEVGPVKYVAEAIADFTGKEFDISQAVRIVIIILVLVFDPLAILLVIAANISIEKYLPKSQPEYRKAKKHLDEINAKIKSSEKELAYKKDSCKSMSESVEENQDTLAESEEDLRKKKEELSLKNQELTDIKSLVKNQQSAEKEISNTISKLKEELQKRQSEYDLATKDLEPKLDELKKNQEKYASEKDSLEMERQAESEKMKNIKKILEESTLENRQVESKNKNALKQINQNNIKISKQNEEIKDKKEMIKSLEDSYQKAVDTSSVIDILKNTNIQEICQDHDSGKLLSIKQDNRIHQFIIPENHCKLSNQYFHEIVNILKEVKDNTDLEFEYNRAIKKFITYNIPKYNFLTI